MAFVGRSEKKASHIRAQTTDSLGPGQYISHEDLSITSKQFAPFNSTSTRKDRKTLQEKEPTPGPGQYHILNQNLEEKVVVSSANEDIKIVEVPKPQSVFKSHTRRFEHKNIMFDNPGPGSYPTDEMQFYKTANLPQTKKSIIDHLMRMNRYQTIPSIPSNMHAYGYTENQGNDLELNKIPSNVFTGLKMDCIGPGQYDNRTTFENNRNEGSSWHKYGAKRLQMPKSQNLVGPGSYDTISTSCPMYKLRQSSGFASKTVRTLDSRKGAIANQFIKNRNVKSQETSRRDSQADTGLDDDEDYEYIEDATPGPGAYHNLSISSCIKKQEKEEKFQFFGSSSDRFKAKNKSNSIGPGDYNPLTAMIGKQIHPIKVRNPPFLSSNTRFEMRNIEEIKPGPGTYEPRTTLEDKLINKIQKGYRGNFGTTERRFKQYQNVEDQPGPGTYLDMIREQEDDNMSPQMCVFKSEEKRIVFPPEKVQKPPVGAYKVDYYDIERRAKVEEEDDPDLAIKRPGFCSSEVRFKHPEAKKEINLDDEEEVPIVDKNKFYKNMNKKKAIVPFNAKARRFNYNKIENLNPGPGNYHDPTTNPWNKRTYNILFAEI